MIFAGFFLYTDKPEKETITILTKNSPTTYYIGKDGPTGFEYDLAQKFALYNGYEIKYKLYDSIPEILQALDNNEGDLACASIHRTDDLKEKYLFSSPYMTVQQQVACKKSRKFPKSIFDLKDFNITIVKNAGFEDRLEYLSDELDGLTWNITNKYSIEQLFQKIEQNEIECTITNSNTIKINRKFYPTVEVAFSINKPNYIGWVMKKDDRSLKIKVDDWFDEMKYSGELSEIKDKYYEHVQDFDYLDIKAFYTRIKSRLPKYIKEFKESASRYDFDWKMLATLSYQESHWNPKAKSPTGVRGIMMLTLKTAKDMRVKNRLDYRQSINGGAKYLNILRKNLPKTIEGDDRMRFLLASYNIGMGHVEDAMSLAKKMGVNPNTWQGISKTLPLLSKRKYYKHLKYGYARGYEPILYVNRIYNYYDILSKMENLD
jgi:membrane-bound lytic murein transglycosylase F